MLSVGIDPGINGAVAVRRYHDTPVSWEFHIMPTHSSGKGARRDVTLFALRDILKGVLLDYHGLPRTDLLVTIEKPPVIPGNNAVALASQHHNYGAILGMLAAWNVGCDEVSPQSWQKLILPDRPSNKGLSQYQREKLGKLYTIAHVQKLYAIKLPTGEKGKVHDGCADAACLADYGMLRGSATTSPGVEAALT